jgi:hypothetical protein
MRDPAENFAITRDQDADIALALERARQGGGDFAKAAHLDEIGKFGGDEQEAG